MVLQKESILQVFGVKHGKKPGRCFPVSLMCLSVFALLSLLLLSSCSLESLSSSTWQASTLSNQHIQTLAVNAQNPQIIYAGDEQGYVFVSMDAGQHWSMRSAVPGKAALPVTSLVLTTDLSGTQVYGATNAGLFVSGDNGQSWRAVGGSSLPTDVYTAPVLIDHQHLYVGTAHHGVYVSNDGGAEWKTVDAGLPTTIAINSITYDILQRHFWLATSDGIYFSSTGEQWQARNSGLPAGTVVTTVQPAANAGGDSTLVYAGTARGLYRSTDSGVHWVGNAALQGALIRAILMDYRSRDATTVYVCTNVGAFRSDDSGQNWGGAGVGIPHDQTVYALVIGAKQSSQLYAASNNVYLYPGNSSTGIDPTRLLSFLLVVLFFIVLVYVIRRETTRHSRNSRRSRQTTGADKKEEETKPTSLPSSSIVPKDEH